VYNKGNVGRQFATTSPAVQKPVETEDAERRMQCAKCDKDIRPGDPAHKLWGRWRHADYARTKAEIVMLNGKLGPAARRMAEANQYWESLYSRVGLRN